MALNNTAPEWWPFFSTGSPMPTTTTTTIILGLLLTLYILTSHLSSLKIHPHEPPVLPPSIPIIGHVLNIALLGGRYIKRLGLTHPSLPIFTLPVPGGSRLYIVTDPTLAAAVQRASRALSFTPLIPDVTARVLGLDDATVAITRRDLDPGPGDPHGFLADIQEMVYLWLGPGDYLTEVTLAAVREMRDEIAVAAAAAAAATQTTSLLPWVRHLVASSTATYLYGPLNPLAQDPSLEAAFWDFDHGLSGLLLNLAPSITARRAYAGRERLVAALFEYLEAGRHEEGASRIVQERVRIALRHGWTLRAVAREELSFLFAGIVNATTSAFWILVQLYADPVLLGVVRREVENVLESESEGEGEGYADKNGNGNGNENGDGDGDGDMDRNGESTTNKKQTNPKRTLRITHLKDESHCPVLVAVYRECLRLGSDTYSTRLVKEDFLLANQYFLKKDAVVQIAGGVIHGDRRIWGDDVDEFNPRRFLADPEAALDPENRHRSREGGGGGRADGGGATNKNNTAYHPAAFRAFGGGKTLCPGRHFAMNEILAFVALVVLRFDMRSPPSGKEDKDSSNKKKKEKKIEVPKKNDGVLPVHILEPVSPVEVVISRREGLVGGMLGEGLDVEIVM
ncbi:cytochrome P450 [Hypoxylon fragiforme]|uniref:cytochrome P450 n=1 Tax=Hypoxylon fragiforme TaxID=63214 RepID=UPI0020C662BE|nr:cytochrome P450 [Hypoxylon fragiforme]KAI2610292.1 cytochrome P450 [Hypoxylon fragiforme]